MMASKRLQLRILSLIAAAAIWNCAAAQDMLQHLDLNAPGMTEAEMTRAEVEVLLQAASEGRPADLSRKRLNGLDLSNLNLTGVVLRSARINNTNFKNANLDAAILDSAWALKADFTGASLARASLFASQMQGAKFDKADLRGARILANLTGASFRNANLAAANCSPDEKNQSMGLMRAVFKSANLEGAGLSNANLARADLSFANLKGANLSGAAIRDGEASGADFRGALLDGSDLTGMDISSARIDSKAGETVFARASNLQRAYKE
jgi:uncharacterized protein YjbI with pentapeptide repeats